jgi:hypothetical protein
MTETAGTMKPLVQIKQPVPHLRGSALLISLVLACFAFSQRAPAVVPAPDGGYPGFNTAEGQNALFSLTTGSANTAVGWFSLFSDTTGSFNTATGAGSLIFNTADANAAFGAAALLFNTTGVNNTAVGAAALLHNTIAEENTATGAFALSSNTEGGVNTATGSFALFRNTTGLGNTANGSTALARNTTGGYNTANGIFALTDNTIGNFNTAEGWRALFTNTNGVNNTACGSDALSNNTTGQGNTALGIHAGANETTGNGNLYLGAFVLGVAGESETTYIKNVYGSSANGRAVYVNQDNKIGTLSSSRRYKEGVKPMEKASEALFALKPITFRYKKEIDRTQALSFGLIAEDVAKINPELITHDQDGKPETVRYEAVNAMLLNEFLKEHRKVEEQEATIAELKKEMETVVARLNQHESKIEKVGDQVELSKTVPQVVLNNP